MEINYGNKLKSLIYFNFNFNSNLNLNPKDYLIKKMADEFKQVNYENNNTKVDIEEIADSVTNEIITYADDATLSICEYITSDIIEDFIRHFVEEIQ